MSGPTITVLGREFEVRLTRYFTLAADVDGEELQAANKDLLAASVSRHLRAARREYAIPIVIRREDGPLVGNWVRAILRGQNARTRFALLTIDGKAAQIDRPSIVGRGAEISDAQIAEANRLLAARRAAEMAMSKFERSVVNPHSRPSIQILLAEADQKEEAAS